ncbi:MAG: hypothetical protein JWQ27_1873 [Ferruginibacter sp.]|nr:hypothetical protein [Ferruginibacter sp.]
MTLLKKIRVTVIVFMVLLALSGITAFPVETELSWLLKHPSLISDSMEAWLQNCYAALRHTNASYPMLAYGYDWLAFAHLVIAAAFIGVYRDPVRNKWIIDWAIVACLAVLPLAFIAGPIRQIPVFHILIDCSFGLIGLLPLFLCRKWIGQLEKTPAI